MTDRYEQEMVGRAGRHPDMIYCRLCDVETTPGEDCGCVVTCRNVRICAEIGEGCMCPENPHRPAMVGPPPKDEASYD